MGVHDEICLGVLTYHSGLSVPMMTSCTSKPSPTNLANAFGFVYDRIKSSSPHTVGEPKKKPVRLRQGRNLPDCFNERCLYEDPYLSRRTHPFGMTVLDFIDQFNVAQGLKVKGQTNRRVVENEQVVQCGREGDGGETVRIQLGSRTKVRTFNTKIALLSNYSARGSSASAPMTWINPHITLANVMVFSLFFL